MKSLPVIRARLDDLLSVEVRGEIFDLRSDGSIMPTGSGTPSGDGFVMEYMMRICRVNFRSYVRSETHVAHDLIASAMWVAVCSSLVLCVLIMTIHPQSLLMSLRFVAVAVTRDAPKALWIYRSELCCRGCDCIRNVRRALFLVRAIFVCRMWRAMYSWKAIRNPRLIVIRYAQGMLQL